MKTRAITGAIFLLVMIASLLLGPYVFTGFYVFLSLFCLLEFFKLIRSSGLKPNVFFGYLIAVCSFLAIINLHFYWIENRWLLLNIPLFMGVFFAELYRKSTSPFNNISYTFLGVIYAVIPFIFFFCIAFISGDYNSHLVLSFFLMLWANDTGAYLFGVKFGKNRLFERHSPKKSWEGFIGGVLVSVCTGFIVANYFKEYHTGVWVGMALIISCFGTLGDLVESMFKRSLNIKDSGSILPGHGGLLDRFDGLLLSAPIVFVYLYLLTY
jgi:phosphatidate cytidylyltransferase